MTGSKKWYNLSTDFVNKAILRIITQVAIKDFLKDMKFWSYVLMLEFDQFITNAWLFYINSLYSFS